MTTFEHAMLGINGVLASGLQHRYQWRIAALAGVAAITPDWDGITILGGMRLFDRAHRAWGHNVLGCLALGLLIAALDYRYDLVGGGRQLLKRVLRTKELVADAQPAPGWLRYAVWTMVAVLATASHLAADLVYSGAEGLSDWELKLLWPFSQQGFVYPMVRWGDAGVTIIFVVMMFAMLKWRQRVQALAVATLMCVVAYIAVRGTLR